MNKSIAMIVAQLMGGLGGPYSNMRNMNQAEHPNIIEDGKLKFWSISRQKYVISACQPKERTK